MAIQNPVRIRRPQGRQPVSEGMESWSGLPGLLSWDPFRDMFGTQMRQQMQAFLPSFDVKETGDAYVFKADLPGVKEEDLDIEMHGSRLTIRGHREAEERREEENYHLVERTQGGFSRTFNLPEDVDPDRVKAELQDGVLTLTAPKTPESQPRKISLGRRSE